MSSPQARTYVMVLEVTGVASDWTTHERCEGVRVKTCTRRPMTEEEKGRSSQRMRDGGVNMVVLSLSSLP